MATAEISDKAWQFFVTTIRDAAPEFPLIQAWRDARDVGRKEGWAGAQICNPRLVASQQGPEIIVRKSKSSQNGSG